MKRRLYTAGFTLIELLIVVAIIAILAAIAVPNFLEAQTRAKVSRVRADLRSIYTGLETYRIDNNNYPLMNGSNTALKQDGSSGPQQLPTLERLTTPISYLTGRGSFADPFIAVRARRLDPNAAINEFDTEDEKRAAREYFYAVRGVKTGGTGVSEHLQWGDVGAKVHWGLMHSAGPKLEKFYFGTEVNQVIPNDTPAARAMSLSMVYDATNGTVSQGVIPRVFGLPSGRGSVLGKMLQQTGN